MQSHIRSRGVLPTLIGVLCFARGGVGFGVDCQPNVIDDACDIECGDIGGPCDVPGCGASFDCNLNGVPDVCDPPPCVRLELVFFFDTSDSMRDDQPAVCDAITAALGVLTEQGAWLESEMRVIRDGGVRPCPCCLPEIEVESVVEVYCPAEVDPQHLCASPYFGGCPYDGNFEDWGFTTAVVAANKEWSSRRRMIFPIGDAGPRCGHDTVVQEDWNAVEAAAEYVAANGVVVVPIVKRGFSGLAQVLVDAGAPGGKWLDIAHAEFDLADELVELIMPQVCPTDCNQNGIPDECEPDEDCNGNDIQDICDIAAGTSNDCNDNLVPDECEPYEDCNGNEIQDICDIAGCEPLVEPACGDCNGNGVPDGCDIAAGTSLDVNANGIPDECVPLPAPYPHDRQKNRYISFDPNKAVMGGANLAFKIELKSIAQGSCNGPESAPCRYAQGTGINEPGDADCRRCAAGPYSGRACMSGPINCASFPCNQTAETCANDDPATAVTNVGLVGWVAPAPPPVAAGIFQAVQGVCSGEVDYIPCEVDADCPPGETCGPGFAQEGTAWADVIHVGDCEIVPQASYGIRAVDLDTGAESEELIVSTIPRPAHGVYAWWADTVSWKANFCNNGLPSGTTCVTDADCGGTPGSCVLGWGPPNGFTAVDDILATLSVFSAFGPNPVSPVGAGPMATPEVADITWADTGRNVLYWYSNSVPDSLSNMSDVQQIGLAFQGWPYPFYDPADCNFITHPSGDAGDSSMPEEGMMGGEMDGPLTSGGLTIVPSPELIQADETVDVQVFADTVENLGGYQVSIEVTGGTAGSLELEAVSIENARADFVFASASISSGTSVNGASLGAVLMSPGGWVFEGPPYLGTFTYRASADAAGVFTVSVRPEPGSFLNDAAGSVIDVSTEAATLVGCGVECMTDGHCDDADECTVDTCVANVCTFNPGPAGVTCDDGKFCTVGEECDGAGACAGGTTPCQPGESCCERWAECRTGSCLDPPP